MWEGKEGLLAALGALGAHCTATLCVVPGEWVCSTRQYSCLFVGRTGAVELFVAGRCVLNPRVVLH